MSLDIEKIGKIFKSLGDTNRLRIVLSIGKGSFSVTEIIHATELSQTLVSFHLRTLRNSGILKTKRNGPFIYYSLSSPDIIDILNKISRVIDSTELITGKANNTFQEKVELKIKGGAL